MRLDSADMLIEAATAAFRDRDPGGRIQPSSAWMDLSGEDREKLFAYQMQSRLLERGLDRQGLSSTARAVLQRIALIRQFTRR